MKVHITIVQQKQAGSATNPNLICMKRFIIVLQCIITICAFSSCATILSGGKTKVRVCDGTPSKAQVYLDGNYKGTAPCTFKIPKTMKNSQHKIDIKAIGYETQTVTTNRKFSAGYFLLDICTGVLWTVVDFATGNLYKQRPRKIHYNLMPNNGSSATIQTDTNIAKPSESITPNLTYKSGDEVYYTSLFSFGKCKQGTLKSVETNGDCVVSTSDGKEAKKTAKNIYIKDCESSNFKITDAVKFGNKIFGYKTGKVIAVPNQEKCIVETSKGDFILKKQSTLTKE